MNDIDLVQKTLIYNLQVERRDSTPTYYIDVAGFFLFDHVCDVGYSTCRDPHTDTYSTMSACKHTDTHTQS